MAHEEIEVEHYFLQVTEAIKMAESSKDVSPEYMQAMKAEYDSLLAIRRECEMKPLREIDRMMLRVMRRLGTKLKQLEGGNRNE